jgi:Tfp pilus assembly PilM family ATPase
LGTLAIGFSQKQIKFVEINENREISFIDNIKTSLDLNKDLSIYRNSDDIISETGDMICNHLEANNIQPNRIDVLLETSQSFMNTVPINFEEDTESIRSQILWELSNYFPDSYKNFRVSYHKLNRKDYPDGIKDTLIIAVDNNKIIVIKEIFKVCNFNIHLTDIDQFATEKCIREVYKEELTDNKILILGCKNSRIDISIIDDRNLVYYDYIIFTGSNFQKGLRKLLNELNVKGMSFGEVMLYGEDYSSDVQGYIKTFDKDHSIELSDPFKKFKYTKNEKGNGNFKNKGFKYTPLIGLALKGI